MKIATISVLALLLVGSALALVAGPFSASETRDALTDPRFYNEAGYQQGQTGDWAGAQASFAHALELDPAFVNARQNLAVAAFHNEDYTVAIDANRALLDADSSNTQYQFDLAQSLVAHARNQETDVNDAVAQLEEAALLLEGLGSYPHAAQNAQIIRQVLAGA